MKATITGSDSLSKRILVDLTGGLRISEVPVNYPVSLDQAKRCSIEIKFDQKHLTNPYFMVNNKNPF